MMKMKPRPLTDGREQIEVVALPPTKKMIPAMRIIFIPRPLLGPIQQNNRNPSHHLENVSQEILSRCPKPPHPDGVHTIVTRQAQQFSTTPSQPKPTSPPPPPPHHLDPV